MDVSAQIAAASARWSHAGVVVVGVDQLREVAAAGLPRRCGVVVFGYPDPDVWRLAVEIGAEAVVTPPGEQGWLTDRVEQAGAEITSGVVVGVLGCRGVPARQSSPLRWPLPPSGRAWPRICWTWIHWDAVWR